MDQFINPTPEALSFLSEWQDSSADFIRSYTSGSTGVPKEIHLLKSDMLASASATCSFFNITSQSTLVCPLSASYIAGKMMIVRAITSGATLYFEEPTSRPLHNNYPPIDLLPIVPAQIPSILKYQQQPIRNIIVGGAPVLPEMEICLKSIEADVYATYGMTETCSHIALRNISAGEESYHALPGITFSQDSRGCLVIIAAEFSFRELITNDIVELTSDKTFRWIGRYDNVIITGGLKVHPEQLEHKLANIIPVPFFITSLPDLKWGNKVAICLEGTYDKATEELLIDKLKKRLPKHEQPREYIWSDKFQRTENGKIKRILPEF